MAVSFSNQSHAFSQYISTELFFKQRVQNGNKNEVEGTVAVAHISS